MAVRPARAPIQAFVEENKIGRGRGFLLVSLPILFGEGMASALAFDGLQGFDNGLGFGF